jgi:ubiquinone/menaquinone biosynthesis C-methylase UbiE
MLRRLPLFVLLAALVALAWGCASEPQAAAPAPGNLDAEQSVKPGINDSWKSDEIQPLIARLETESREIYTHRAALAAVAGPRVGTDVADIGAGSGFMTELLAELVGPNGTVYAVDINPVMMGRLARRADENGIDNLQIVVCSERTVDLPPESVDMVFICDTYHHFEYPRTTMRSIHEALRPGGQIVLVDFHRIPGVSPEWILGHVRAGEEVFTQEIVDSGFELINDHAVPFLEENYVLRFRKQGD